MRTRSIALMLTFFAFGSIGAHTTGFAAGSQFFRMAQESPAVDPRLLLSRQPDFTATQIYTRSEPRRGSAMQVAFPVAKRGPRFRLETDLVIIIYRRGERPLRLFKNTKTYEVMDDKRIRDNWTRNVDDVEVFSQAPDVRFVAIGTDTIDGHKCQMIRAMPISKQKGRGPTEVVLYAATDLENLVIRIEIHDDENPHSYQLTDIVRGADPALFEVPIGYVLERT
jgi:hypothetical protein